MFDEKSVISVGSDSRAENNWIEMPYKIRLPGMVEFSRVKVKDCCLLESRKGEPAVGYRYTVVALLVEGDTLIARELHLVYLIETDNWHCEELEK